MACQEAFYRELRGRGLRLTPQRELVLSALHELEGLATAEQIYDRVQVLSTAVDISTVYRTLDLFQEFGVVTGVDGADGQRRYELAAGKEPHVHLVCGRCGTVISADQAPVRALADTLRAGYGFELDLNRLSLSGLCPACR
jgi:Fur family ferric uptake transcriptional regulator